MFDYIIDMVKQSTFAFCRYITINDTGLNGSHQSGFLIPKAAGEAIFGEQLVRGGNIKLPIKVLWMGDFETDSVFTYYGRKKNEIRLTNFGRSFPFFQEQHIGDLLIMARLDSENYCGVVLSSEQDIDDFQAYFNLVPGQSNQVILNGKAMVEQRLSEAVQFAVDRLQDFPATVEMAQIAREIFGTTHRYSPRRIVTACDQVITRWIDLEYRLFQAIEEKIYASTYSQPFANCQALVDFANTILNRRKSRAGKSLEHHLAHLFTVAKLRFEAQPLTEANKRPDFIFPDGEAYHNLDFPDSQLTFLGAKTTCKDRWRQVLNEADRIKQKYLFTLQPGVSTNQMNEMKSENLWLVVPQQHFSCFDHQHCDNLISLSQFIAMVQEQQKHL